MKHSFYLRIAALATFLLAGSAHAQWQFSAAAGARQATVTEVSPAGQRLVQEEGWLPGLELQASRSWDKWRFRAAAQIFHGDIDYDGKLQSGAPFSSTTGTGQQRIDLEVGRALTDTTRLLGGVEWDRWTRTIRGHDGILGLNEQTISRRWLTGLEFRLPWSPAGSTIVSRALAVFAEPERLNVQFDKHVYDDAALDTKSAVGARLSVEVHPAGMPRLGMLAEYDWMRIDRSDDSPLLSNGAPAGTLAQPEHTRRGLSLMLIYRF